MQISLLFCIPCTLYGKVQNLRLKCASSVLRASPHCKHTVGAFQPGIFALALFHAALLAFARDNKLSTDLGCFG